MYSSIFKSLIIGAFLFASHASAEILNWDINFLELIPDFTKDGTNEIALKYEIGTARSRIQIDLFDKGCIVPIEGTTIATTHSTTSKDSNHDYLEVLLDLDKQTIATSNVWNSLSSTIDLCVRLQLVSELQGVITVINQDARDITVSIDFKEQFDANDDPSLDKASLSSASVNTSVGNYIEACTCDPTSHNCITEALKPNSIMNICVKSKKNEDMIVKYIDSLLLTQGDKQLQLFSAGQIVNNAITSETPITAGILVASLIPSEFFSYDSVSTADLTGVASLWLPASRRLDNEITGYTKVRATNSTRALTKRFGDQQVSTFVINLQLERKEWGDAIGANTAQIQYGFLAFFVPTMLSISYAAML